MWCHCIHLQLTGGARCCLESRGDCTGFSVLLIPGGQGIHLQELHGASCANTRSREGLCGALVHKDEESDGPCWERSGASNNS